MSKQYKNSKYLVLLLAMTLLTTNVAYGREGELNDDSSLRGNVEIQNKIEDRDEKEGEDNDKEKIENSTFREEAKKLKDEYEAKLDALKAKLGTPKDEKGKIKAKKDELKISNRRASVERWGKAVEKSHELAEKLNKVILKAKNSGIDTTNAEASLKEANLKIASVEANAKLMMDIVVKPLPMSDVDKAELTKLAKETQTLVKEANSLLQKVSKELRSAMQAKRKINKEEKENKTN